MLEISKHHTAVCLPHGSRSGRRAQKLARRAPNGGDQLRALVFAREWRSHCLVVHIVRSLTPSAREQTLYRKMELALQGYPHIVRGPHG